MITFRIDNPDFNKYSSLICMYLYIVLIKSHTAGLRPDENW